MRTRVKICGITRDEDARAAVDAGADALGFVFWRDSPRAVTASRVAGIARNVAVVARVGVVVDSPPDAVAAIVREAALDAVQLHGTEMADDFARCGAPIIKAVALASEDDLDRALALPSNVTLLVDAGDSVRRGGTGRVADWRLARRLSEARRILLAGGLNPSNVAQAIREVRPWAVDVSSGVERAPGIKDREAIEAFCQEVARADREAM